MPGIYGESEFKTNSHGIRGEELAPQHTNRIIALGGSTTECGYLDQKETWPYLLQETLNEKTRNQKTWVGNAGVSGTTTRNHLIALQHLPLWELKIDTVILLVGINDLSKRLSQDNQYDPDYMEKHEAKKKLASETFKWGALHEDPFYKKTAIWQLLKNTKLRMSNRYNQDKAGNIYITWREHRQKATQIRDDLPDLSSALDEYARNINKIIDIAQEKSLRLILVTQPTIWRPDLPPSLNSLLWFGGIGDFQNGGKPYYSVTALEKGIKAYNDTLIRICWERQIECLDLASILEKDTTVFYDDVHFNESGARKVAEALSGYMLR